MNRFDTDRIWQDLHLVADDVEKLLQDTNAAAGGQTGELRERARRRLSDARSRLRHIEHDATGYTQEAAAEIESYAHRSPWVLAGSAAAAAFVLGLLSCGSQRHR